MFPDGQSRETINQIIMSESSKDFRDEVDYWLGLDREYDCDPLCALFDIEARAEDWINDGVKEAKRLLKEARLFLVKFGFYRAMTQDEIDNTYTSNGVSSLAF